MQQALDGIHRKTILSLCDRTGAWSRPYADAGYRVITVDLQPEQNPHPNREHWQQNVRLMRLPEFRLHGVLAAPDCTMFALSGNRWERTEQQMQDAIGLADACMRLAVASGAAWWAVENPTGKLAHYWGPPAFRFDPAEFTGWPGGEADRYTKRTCLWGRFSFPEKRPGNPTDGSRMHRLPPGPERKNQRSATPMGFARAFFAANS
jgi:hypothetical protein